MRLLAIRLKAGNLTQLQMLAALPLRIRYPDSRVCQIVDPLASGNIDCAGSEQLLRQSREAFARRRFTVGEEVDALRFLDLGEHLRAPSLPIEHHRDRPARR